MMRFIIVMVLTAIATWLTMMVMPWWVAMPVAFCLVLIFPMKHWQSFLATGLGAAMAFLLLCFMADQANEHILSSRMATLFQLPSYTLMQVLTALVGGITAGLGGWTASALCKMLRPRPSAKDAPMPTK